MLVLSRQKNQRVKFPGLGITVEILDIRGSKVRVGVDAPMEVRILRDELPDHGGPAGGRSGEPAASPLKAGAPRPEPRTLRLPRALRHELRNALHEASLMMHVYRKQIAKHGADAAGDASHRPIEADQMFEAILRRLENLAGHKSLSPLNPGGGVAGGGDAPTGEGVGDGQRSVRRAESTTEDAPQATARGGALIVDDDANERELLAGFLRLCDYAVDTVEDGRQALDYLGREAAPGVILLDMGMPRCDGAQFLREFRGSPASGKSSVFVVSGATPEEVGVSPDLGYTRWFGKPLDPCRVVEELKKVETRVA